MLDKGNIVDQSTLARINLNALLRTLEQLPELDEKTANLVSGDRHTIQFIAPRATTMRLILGGGTIGHFPGPGPHNIGLLFPVPSMVNKMFDGAGLPIPVKGFRQLDYLKGPFTKITDRLSYFLRPTHENLADETYRKANSVLTMHLAGYALAEIGNSDAAGRHLASQMADGSIQFAVKDGPALVISCRNHRLRVTTGLIRDWRAKMVFSDLESAGAVLRGEVASYTAIGHGQIKVGGYLPLLDAMNKLLSFIPRYLG